MRIDLPQPRARKLSMTSLIDVIFLLLLFFMLTSTFTKFAEVEVALPGGSGGGASKGPDVILTVEDKLWRLNGGEVDPEQVVQMLEGLKEKGAKSLLLLPKGEDTDAQDLVSAIETVQRVKGLSLIVAR